MASQQRQLDISTTTLDEVSKAITPGKPVYMVNFLRFKPTATYHPSDPSEMHSLPTVTGREAFQNRYVPSFIKVAKGSAAEVVLWAKALGTIMGPLDGSKEEWDDVAVLKYKDVEEWRRLVTSEEYRLTAMPHRLAALEDRRLVAVEAYAEHNGDVY